MNQEIFPPLPDPAENQSPEARRALGHRLIKQARHEFDAGDRLQAGGKAWGAAVQFLKIIGERRGWGHKSNRQLQSLGSHLAAEYPDIGVRILQALSDAYHKGHENYYENQRGLREVREAVEGVEEIIPILERLAQEQPRPFTIESNSQLRRLRVLTGRDDLKVGDSSEVGFSLRDRYNSSQMGERVARESGPAGMPTLQDIVRGLMQTLLEDYPELLTDGDLQNLMQRGFCRSQLGLQLAGRELIRLQEAGRIVNGRSRYWQKLYAGRYYITSEWWKQYHTHNAASLLRWVEQLIERNPAHPGLNALQRHSDELRLYLEA